jgi:hypothetical protein
MKLDITLSRASDRKSDEVQAMEIKKRTGASYLPFLGIIIVITFSLLALAHILSTKRKLHRASHAGRAISLKSRPPVCL